jgi:UDP-GlcNAc:undecaprenyl-phosphate GlcNAc-1-phosphate transferase
VTTAWMVRITLGFVLGGLLSWYLTPIFRRAALGIGLVDRPDGKLKRQTEPVPYLGGLAVYLAFLFAISLAYEFSPQILGLLLAGTIVLLLGLIDDFGVLSPGAKFIGQAVAAFVLIRAGISIDLVFLPRWVDLPLTVVWLIGVTNAFNLSDIMDGLAGGLALAAAATLLVVNLLNGDMVTALLSAGLAGSIAGFLPYNFQPARIYLGDAGSLFLGLMIGALAMIGRYTEVSPVGALAPVLILGLPIFDTIFVMYVRRRRGISMFLGSPDHIPLRLRKWRLSVRQTVLTSCGIGAALGAAGLVLMHLATVPALTLFTVVLLLVLFAAVWLKRIDMTL